MSTVGFKKNLDQLVEAAEDRAKAAKQLRDIALRHPDLLRQAVEFLDQKPAVAQGPKAVRARLRLPLPPTDAVRHWLKNNPKGGTSGEIVRGVVDNVQTESEKPASVVYSTIAVMKRRGLLVTNEREGKPAIYTLAPTNNGTAHQE